MNKNDEVIPTENFGSNKGEIPFAAIVLECFEEQEGLNEYLILTTDNRKLLVYDYEIENTKVCQ